MNEARVSFFYSQNQNTKTTWQKSTIWDINKYTYEKCGQKAKNERKVLIFGLLLRTGTINDFSY